MVRERTATVSWRRVLEKVNIMKSGRMGEIALLLIKHWVRKEGFRLSGDSTGEIENAAKKLGISSEEMMEFSEILLRELVDEIFPPKDL